MRYLVFACDYDNTIAREGRVSEATLARLEKLLATGRKLLLVTGREMDDLKRVVKHVKLFHQVVAENGAMLYDPAQDKETLLAAATPPRFSQALREHGVERFSAGRVIVSALAADESGVTAAIRELGLELQTIPNRESLMVLPAGVNKASGLKAALKALSLTPHEVVAVGDAENDHAFLDLSEFSVAVGNALPALKEHADWVTASSNGAGVCELIDELLENDLEPREAAAGRRTLLLGTRGDQSEVRLSPRGPNILIGGPSGSGKSTAAMSLIERLLDAKYQFCIIDPEGDYEGIEGTVTLGRGGRGPLADEVMELLAQPQHNVIVNLIGLPVAERPPFFLELLPRLHDLRAHTGRPHWLLLDEAHHLLPASWEPSRVASVGGLERTALVTVHPDQVSPAVLKSVGLVVAVGRGPAETFALFAKPLGIEPPRVELDAEKSADHSAVLWPLAPPGEAAAIHIAASRLDHQRHVRKYAVGELPPDRSFYFRGPGERLNLRAQNLELFLQLAAGVDAETWLYHLRRGDYSHWFRTCVKDETLAEESEAIEREKDISRDESLKQIRALVEKYYVPSTVPLPIPGTDAARARG